MTVKYELAVKTGSYEKNGETKNRYQNIGVIMDKGDGPFLLLKRWFNPAAFGEGENVMVSLFKPKAAQVQSETAPAATPPQDEITF